MKSSTIRSFALGVVSTALALGAVAASCTPASADGPITEDSPAWNCVTMGNQVCGPTNPQHAAPGQYVAGNLVVPWPVTRVCRTIAATGFQWCESKAATTLDGGCYSNAGTLVATKPCYFVVNSTTGQADIFKGVK